MRIRCIILNLILEALSSFLFILFITFSSNVNTTFNNISIDTLHLQSTNKYATLHLGKGKTFGKRDSSSENVLNGSINGPITSKSQPPNSMRLNILIGSLLFGLSLSMGIQVNPACSLAQWLTNPKGMQSNAVFSWLSSLFAQYFGGVLACLLCVKHLGHTFQFNPPSTSAALVSEIFGTFFLVIVLLHFKTYFDNAQKTFTIYFIETVTIAWISFAFMTASRGCLNPALASCSFYAIVYFNGFALHPIAPTATILDNAQWIKMTPYYIGPYIGSFLASIAYRSMIDVVDDTNKPLLDKTSTFKSITTVELPSADFYA